jgi:uncharacterized SAM-binding protein YcdF (DUF218 family)
MTGNGRSPWWRWRWSLWLGVFAPLALLLTLVAMASVWLPALAGHLVVDDPLSPADVIVVFAGGRGERAQHAADLYRRGLAGRILMTGGETARAVELFCNRRVTGAELNAKLLLDAGIPEGVMTVLPHGTSTYEEADIVREHLRSRGYRSAIAVSSAYHMRRVRTTLLHHLRNEPITVQVSPAPTPEWEPRAWWRDERSLLLVTNEYLKLAYYHLALL